MNAAAYEVVVGVTGCIAAYKACEIVRGLQKAGVKVRVAMTEHATQFVAPLTFKALTGTDVAVGMFENQDDPIPHISLGQKYDALCIAPCTANMLAKIAHGIADDLLSSTALACTAPLVLAPAMNVHMYNNAATQENIELLRKRGAEVIEADEGYLACTDEGKGRLPEPQAIVDVVLGVLGASADLAGTKVLVTAGPTQEPIDPVRCITNYSSGKMGYAIARAARKRGASVTLVSGPVNQQAPDGIKVIKVQTAREMLDATEEAFDDADIAIFSAAVSDMRPRTVASSKLKKGANDDQLSTVELVANPDILATLAARKDRQVVVGFAAETDDVIDNAQAKLMRKGADIFVANQVGAGLGFGTDDNEAWLVSAAGVQPTGRIPKLQLADVILDACLEFLP